MLSLYYEEGVNREKPFIERDVTTKTEQAGYVDTETQVKRMLFAGENLMAYKKSAYEFPESEFDLDTVRPDPTLEVGFDPADADLYRRKVSEKIKVSQKRKQLEKADDSQDTQTESKTKRKQLEKADDSQDTQTESKTE